MNEEREPAIWIDDKGEEHINEEVALAELLLDGVLFANERELVERPWKVVDGKLRDDKDALSTHSKATTILFVLCNDLFYWGTADALRLPYNEIGNLYRMNKADPKYGSSKWCCFQEKLRPQVPIVERMKADGVWDEAMEALPAPAPS